MEFEEVASAIFALEIFCIAIVLGLFSKSILVFLISIIGLLLGVYKYQFKPLVIGITLVSIFVFGYIGWFAGVFIAMFFSDLPQIGGIVGAIFAGFIALAISIAEWSSITN